METRGKGFTEITRELASWLDTLAADNGLLTVFIWHTSASLLIQENADPDVQLDLLDAWMPWRPRAVLTSTTPKAPTTCRATSTRRSRR